MPHLNFLLFAFLFLASFGLSFGLVPVWEDLGGCAQGCIGSSLHGVLDDSGSGPRNQICAGPPSTASHCNDFCDDPAYNSAVKRCLKINCPPVIYHDVIFLNTHIICNISQRQNLIFNQDAQGNWNVHWPGTLTLTGVATDLPPPQHTPRPSADPAWFAAIARDLHGEFPNPAIGRPGAESTTVMPIMPINVSATLVSPGANATTTSTCLSIATATSVVVVTVTPSHNTSFVSPVKTSSAPCSCNSTSTITTFLTSTLSQSSVHQTASTTSILSFSTTTTLTSTHSKTITSHLTTTTAVHSNATATLPALHTATNAATAVDAESQWLAIGFATMVMAMLGLL